MFVCCGYVCVRAMEIGLSNRQSTQDTGEKKRVAFKRAWICFRTQLQQVSIITNNSTLYTAPTTQMLHLDKPNHNYVISFAFYFATYIR